MYYKKKNDFTNESTRKRSKEDFFLELIGLGIHVSDEGKVVTFLLYLFSDQTPAALVQMKMILADQLQRCTCFKSTSRHQTNVSKYFMKMTNFVWM